TSDMVCKFGRYTRLVLLLAWLTLLPTRTPFPVNSQRRDMDIPRDVLERRPLKGENRQGQAFRGLWNRSFFIASGDKYQALGSAGLKTARARFAAKPK